MSLKIGVYALARNEEKHVFDWSHSCDEADVRVVTDTGSTDSTVDRLRQSGVTVATGNVVPWRWDDAHNLSLYHLPSDLDVCIRLDLDERLSPGWRDVIEREWTDGTNQLFYKYVWSWASDGTEDLVFIADRIHSRRGFRWSAPTHEGLICWHGEKRSKMITDLQIFHFRDKGKKHTTDLELLRIAVREAPHDARAQWYLAREMDYAGMPEAREAFERYLQMDGGIATERAFACRILWKLTGDPAYLVQATAEAPDEPEAWERLAFLAYRQREWAKRPAGTHSRHGPAGGCPVGAWEASRGTHVRPAGSGKMAGRRPPALKRGGHGTDARRRGVSSYLRQIADALATSLDGVTWAIQSTTVERKNWVSIDVESMANPVVYVTPGSADVTRIGRRQTQVDYDVQVFVGRHVTTDQDVDGMLDLANDIFRQVKAHQFDDIEDWPEGVTSPQTVTIDLNPDDALSERNVWRAAIVATYRVLESDDLPE
jgi:hypothetical protein